MQDLQIQLAASEADKTTKDRLCKTLQREMSDAAAGLLESQLHLIHATEREQSLNHQQAEWDQAQAEGRQENARLQEAVTDRQEAISKLQTARQADAEAMDQLQKSLDRQVQHTKQSLEHLSSLQEKLATAEDELCSRAAEKDGLDLRLLQAGKEIQEQRFSHASLLNELTALRDGITERAQCHTEAIHLHQQQVAELEQVQAVLTQQVLDMNARLQLAEADTIASNKARADLDTSYQALQAGHQQDKLQLQAADTQIQRLEEHLLQAQHDQKEAATMQQAAQLKLDTTAAAFGSAESQVELLTGQLKAGATDLEKLQRASNVLTASLEASRWQQQSQSEQLREQDLLIQTLQQEALTMKNLSESLAQSCKDAQQCCPSLQKGPLQQHLPAACSQVASPTAKWDTNKQSENEKVQMQNPDSNQGRPREAWEAENLTKRLLILFMNLASAGLVQQELLQEVVTAESQRADGSRHGSCRPQTPASDCSADAPEAA